MLGGVRVWREWSSDKQSGIYGNFKLAATHDVVAGAVSVSSERWLSTDSFRRDNLS